MIDPTSESLARAIAKGHTMADMRSNKDYDRDPSVAWLIIATFGLAAVLLLIAVLATGAAEDIAFIWREVLDG